MTKKLDIYTLEEKPFWASKFKVVTDEGSFTSKNPPFILLSGKIIGAVQTGTIYNYECLEIDDTRIKIHLDRMID